MLGEAGVVPGWPGAEVCPAQPQVTQIRDVLDRCAAAGGAVRIEMFPGSGHGPNVDALSPLTCASSPACGPRTSTCG